jgi:parvulin-like peptidyl-prolyl isomerase
VELSHLVHAVGNRALRSPAIHFLAIGGLLFAAAGRQGDPVASERTQLPIPRHRMELARSQFAEAHGRPPTRQEDQALVETLVDEEILYQYALRVGLDQQPVVERRLAQIAEFVEQDPHEPGSQAGLALEARGLGLHQRDPVVRRVLIDAAKRLIRAAVRVRAPTEEMMESFLRTNQDAFMVPSRTRITHVTINRLARGSATEARARALLKRVKTGALGADVAPALGDEAFAPPSLPLLTDRDLERRFGYRFVEALAVAPVGEWSGPVPSRYGLHLVYVHERAPPYLPPLSEIRTQVRRRLVDRLADEWLAFRLQQLRAEFDVVVPDRTS